MGLLVVGSVKVGSEGGRTIVALLDRTVTGIVWIADKPSGSVAVTVIVAVPMP